MNKPAPFVAALAAMCATACGTPLTANGLDSTQQAASVDPAAPKGLTAVTPTADAPALSWAASSGAAGYRVLRDGTVVGTATSISWVDQGLTTSGAYSYTVKAYNSADTSAASAALAVRFDVLPPNDVKGLVGDGLTRVAPSFSWAAVTDLGGSGIKQYNLRRDGIYFASTPALSFVEPAALPDGTYLYEVRAEDLAGNLAANFASLQVTLDTVAPAAPAGLLAPVVSGHVALSWSASSDSGSGVSSYQVLRDGAVLATVSGTQHSDTPAGAGSFVYRVRAVDAAGNLSALSTAVTVTFSAFMPSTMDGQVHRATSLHYYPGTKVTDLATAQKLARAVDLICLLPGSGGNNSQLTSFADDMKATHPGLMMITYGKSVQSSSPAGTYPNAYYAHTADGSKILFDTFHVYIMQANKGGPFTDPRGFTTQTWREWRAKDAWWFIDDLNASATGSPYGGVYLDSMGPLSYIGPPVNPDTGRDYAIADWIDLSRTIGDEAMARGGGRMVWGNGLQKGSKYFGGSSPSVNLLDHVNGGLAESWLRSNGAPPTAFRTTAEWEQDVDMVIDAGRKSKYVWVVVNIFNSTAGGGSNPGFSSADLDRWHTYSVASYLLANRGTAYLEFVESNAIKPWDEQHPAYNVQLGAPLDTFDSAAAYQNGCVYRRRYAAGAVFVNASNSSCTFTADRTYRRLDGSALSGSITLGPNAGLVVTH